MTTTLRDGTTTQDRRLDRLVEFDEASRRFGVMRTLEYAYPRPYTYRCPHHLDQGQEGACVEFAWVHEMLSTPAAVDLTVGQEITRQHAIYWPAQRDDYWPGGSYPGASPVYEGTSVLAGAKRAQALGYITSYFWAFGIEQALMAIGRKGPCVLGVDWLAGMFEPDADGFIHAVGSLQGGHAILAKGIRLFWLSGTTSAQKRSAGWFAHLDLDRSYVILHNSWGPTWSVLGGDCKISVRDLDVLLRRNGEVCVPVGRKRTSLVPITNV